MSRREIVYEYEGKEDFERLQTIVPGDASYPEQLIAALGVNAPRNLFCCGNISLLIRPSVMVCGARNASETALCFAYRCGRSLTNSNMVVASGYARGVDMAAHRGALDAGGSTLAFLPYGVARFTVHRNIREAFDPERFLRVSERKPWQIFSSPAALHRNKLLAAIARAVIVIEPGESGGTWYSAEQAHHLGRPLFFLEGNRPEVIGRLEQLGGVQLTVRDGEPDIEPLEAAIRFNKVSHFS